MAKELRNILIHRLTEPIMIRCAHQYLRGPLLDIGCGTKPYRSVLAGHIGRHVGVDHALPVGAKGKADIVSTAYLLPVASGSFQSVLCTAVLEHLEEPEQALRECHRVLRNGGFALYDVPLIWHVHEAPRDFYRYTCYGLRYLFHKVGFEVIELIPVCGFWGTFGQLLVYNIYRLHRKPLSVFGIVPAIALIIQFMAYFMDRIDRTERWASSYVVVAVKRSPHD